MSPGSLNLGHCNLEVPSLAILAAINLGPDCPAVLSNDGHCQRCPDTLEEVEDHPLLGNNVPHRGDHLGYQYGIEVCHSEP